MRGETIAHPPTPGDKGTAHAAERIRSMRGSGRWRVEGDGGDGGPSAPGVEDNRRWAAGRVTVPSGWVLCWGDKACPPPIHLDRRTFLGDWRGSLTAGERGERWEEGHHGRWSPHRKGWVSIDPPPPTDTIDGPIDHQKVSRLMRGGLSPRQHRRSPTSGTHERCGRPRKNGREGGEHHRNVAVRGIDLTPLFQCTPRPSC